MASAWLASDRGVARGLGTAGACGRKLWYTGRSAAGLCRGHARRAILEGTAPLGGDGSALVVNLAEPSSTIRSTVPEVALEGVDLGPAVPVAGGSDGVRALESMPGARIFRSQLNVWLTGGRLHY